MTEGGTRLACGKRSPDEGNSQTRFASFVVVLAVTTELLLCSLVDFYFVPVSESMRRRCDVSQLILGRRSSLLKLLNI